MIEYNGVAKAKGRKFSQLNGRYRGEMQINDRTNAFLGPSREKVRTGWGCASSLVLARRGPVRPDTARRGPCMCGLSMGMYVCFQSKYRIRAAAPVAMQTSGPILAPCGPIPPRRGPPASDANAAPLGLARVFSRGGGGLRPQAAASSRYSRSPRSSSSSLCSASTCRSTRAGGHELRSR